MSENTMTACDEIETGLLKIRRALETLEQPLNFEGLTVQELRWLKEYAATIFTQANRLDALIQTVFNQEK